MKESKIKGFINDFKEFFKGSKIITFLEEYPLPIGDRTNRIDFAILRNNEFLAIFEFKEKIDDSELQFFYQNKITVNLSYKYLIFTNGISHKVLDRYSEEIKLFDSAKLLFEHIIRSLTKEEITRLKNEIAKTINNAVVCFFENFEIEEHKILNLKQDLLNCFSIVKILNNIQFNEDGQFFHFSNDIRELNNYENNFFKILIEKLDTNDFIYRYSNLNTVYDVLKNNSIRLNGIVGMNDISEVGYVDEFLNSNFKPFANKKVVERINNRFIFCSSILKDNLMQWRLYADDCKGACIKFKVKDANEIPGIQLGKINYGINVDGENSHPELELISSIIQAVRNENRQSIQFRAFSIWKHFFKSFEYEPECEVRLLYILSNTNEIKGQNFVGLNAESYTKDWCLTYSHQILNPFIIINLDDEFLPIKLDEIILGPKCPENFVNKKQFNQLLIEKNLGNVEVNLSSIKNYR